MAPPLFMKADMAAANPDRLVMNTNRRLVRGRASWLMASVTPDNVSVRLITNTAATVTVAGWPKPEKASTGLTSPTTTAANSAAKAMTSKRKRPQARSRKKASRIVNRLICSVVKPRLPAGTARQIRARGLMVTGLCPYRTCG